MDTWAYHTGKLDEDGNFKALEDEDDVEKDKYWQKYMSDSSPYRVKFSPPAVIKASDRPQSGNATGRRLRKKKRPRWMTAEEYDRLMTKSNVKKHDNDKEEEKDKYFDNDGEILRWPEILQQRPKSPALKHARATSPKPGDHEDSNLDELEVAGPQRPQGTYRPSSAPVVKMVAKNLFKKQELNDMLIATSELPHAKPNGDGGNHQRTMARTSPKGIRHTSGGGGGASADPNAPNEEDDGIIEYGDTYVIENEDEAIDRIQTAMISAVVKSASPPDRRRHRSDADRVHEEHYKKIGDDLFVSGKIVETNCGPVLVELY